MLIERITSRHGWPTIVGASPAIGWRPAQSSCRADVGGRKLTPAGSSAVATPHRAGPSRDEQMAWSGAGAVVRVVHAATERTRSVSVALARHDDRTKAHEHRRDQGFDPRPTAADANASCR